MAPRNAIRALVAAVVLSACAGARGVAPTTSAPPTTAGPLTTTVPLPDGLIVPPQCEEATIATVPPGATTTTTMITAALDAETQRGLVAAFDEHVREVYFDPEFGGVAWEDEIARLVAEVNDGMETSILYERLDALLESLGDEHSRFETPQQVAIADEVFAGQNDYVGIGILAMSVPEDQLISIISVLPGSPADIAGLRSHDSIVAVDGIPLGEEPGIESNRLRGPECTIVEMTVRAPDGSERVITTVRARVQGSIPIEFTLLPDAAGRQVAYLLIPTFADATIDDQVRDALEAAGPLDALVIDLRTNGGGSSQVAEPVMALFRSGALGEYSSREGTRTLVIDAEPIHNSASVPLAILVGDHTESYGEIVAGILAGREGTVLVGETTDGNVETLHGFVLPGGAMVWIAAEIFVPADDPDADWERDGIVPDIIVDTDWEDVTLGDDPAVDAAVAALLGG